MNANAPRYVFAVLFEALKTTIKVGKAHYALWGLILLATPMVTTAQQSGDFTYSTNASGATITKYTGSTGSVTIPDLIGGLPVTAIGPNAFRFCTFTNVAMGNSVTTIGTNAFYSCTNLMSVTLGSGVLTIGYGAFYSCIQLGDITLPGHVTSIGILAFGGCSGLSSITIPASITNIGNSAFSVCSDLTSITVDSQNQFFSSANGVLFDKNQTTLLQYPGGIPGNYRIPDGVITIGVSAFQYCYQLTGVTIPESLTSIALQAFGSCPRLTTMDVDTNNPVFASLTGVLFDKNFTTLIVCPGGTVGGYAIPDGVVRIADYGFYKCGGLTDILIPSSVVVIGNAAFFGCSSLTSLTLHTNVTSIGSSAFGATGVRNLTLPNSITNIADSLFFACRQLTNIFIPDGVRNIGSGAFQGCDGLTSIIIPGSVLFIGNAAFFALSGLEGVYFGGDAPSLGNSVFFGSGNVTIYYLPGTAGWDSTFGGRPTALWQPKVLTGDANVGVQTNGFGVSIAWANGKLVVVDATTDLVNPVWTAVRTNTLVGGSFYFSDAEWTNHPARFYRIRSP